MTYGVLAADGTLRHHVPIELPGARLPHDMAVTEHYSILMDLPLLWDPRLLQRDIHKVEFFASCRAAYDTATAQAAAARPGGLSLLLGPGGTAGRRRLSALAHEVPRPTAAAYVANAPRRA